MAKPTKKPDPTLSVLKAGSRKDQPELSRSDKLSALMQGISKQYDGKVVIRQGEDISNVFALRRPTGITTLDLKLGGGFPAGGLSQIIGRDSSGKSYLVNCVMRQVQETYGTDAAIGICMTEMPWDKIFAKWWCGVKVAFSDLEIERLMKYNEVWGQEVYKRDDPFFKEQVGTVHEARAATAEHLLEAACKMVESNLYQVILIDSFGALLTTAEAEADEGIMDKHRGGASMVITQFMHRLHAALNMPDSTGKQNTTTVLGINQYRDNVTAGLYGNPMKQAGGWALRHGKLVDLFLQQGKKHTIQVGPDKVIVGKEISWELLKGKAGCHDGPKGQYNFYFGEHGHPKGIDLIADLLACALEYGIVDQSGAWYSFRGERIGQGAANATATLSGNPLWVEEIRKDIFKKAQLQFITKEDF